MSDGLQLDINLKPLSEHVGYLNHAFSILLDRTSPHVTRMTDYCPVPGSHAGALSEQNYG